MSEVALEYDQWVFQRPHYNEELNETSSWYDQSDQSDQEIDQSKGSHDARLSHVIQIQDSTNSAVGY